MHDLSRYLPSLTSITIALLSLAASAQAQVRITGDLKTWHAVTLELEGPSANESDVYPNPFTDYNMEVTFTHESGKPSYVVPGYFAADGNAAETSATSGKIWRAHLSPDKTGSWNYEVHFTGGKYAALGEKGEPLAPYNGLIGSFRISGSDKSGPDFRAHGRLQYVRQHYLRFAESGKYFLKAGPDAPESFLAYTDFDNTIRSGERGPLKTWEPHVRDWRRGDPVWKGNRGKGMIGALNYLAESGMNAFSFLTYNAGGDGQNVWPFIARDDKMHYDVSKLDQWNIVFSHAQSLGLYLHFKLQEQEMDDDRIGHSAELGAVPEALDGGRLGPERKLYMRELIARFGHHLALNWNIGEENTQSLQEIRDMAKYIRDTDPYDHHIVIHTFPNWQDRVYSELIGGQSVLTGASLQNGWSVTHQRTLKWVTLSAAEGKPWVVANDEQGPAALGVPPDPGYEGFSGVAEFKQNKYDLHDIRKKTLWGNLMAGGAGVEYYFGYQLPQNDLIAQDFRSRHQSWQFCRIALDFFHQKEIPFWRMNSANQLVSFDNGDAYVFAEPNQVYLVYLPEPGEARLDLTYAYGSFSLHWFNPRSGGELQTAVPATVKGGTEIILETPSMKQGDDWLAVLRKQ